MPTAPVKKETQIIAIYGKGGIGKSFTLANLSYMMAQQGKKVLLIGCDPKSDTTSLLFGGKACPTIIETSTKKKLAGEAVAIGDVCFKRDGVYAMELGGPEVGRGCGGRGIIHGFELLEKLGFHEWGFDFVLLDFLGDVVCGGFGLPIARDMCQKVIVVGSNDLQSLYVANNVCSAVEYFRKLGGNVGVGGLVINKDDGTGEAQAFAEAAGIPVLASIPADDDIRRKSANYEIIGRPEGRWGSLFSDLAANVADAAPHRPTPLTQDGLLGLFSSDVDRPRRGSGAGDPRGHVRRRPRDQAVPRSRLRRGLTRMAVSLDIADLRARKAPATIDLAAAQGDGLGCHAGKDAMVAAAEAAGMSETLAQLRERLPAGPARPAAEHVPGLRIAARRPAHAPDRHDPLRLGLLRLRPDLHVALLRRPAQRRLRAVQLGDAGHRQAVRGYPRRGLRHRRSPRITTPSWSSTSAFRRPPAFRCGCCRRRSTASG